jgi:hypothetical protein
MIQTERCEKNPSILKAFCSHCNGLQRGTTENPVFSLGEESVNGMSLVTVLKNGGPIHLHDQKFRFGLRNARLMLACLPELREFWQGTDEQRRQFAPRIRNWDDLRPTATISISVEMCPSFERSDTGELIDEPFLVLRSSEPDVAEKGLGYMKCRAICAVKAELQNWVEKVGTKTQRRSLRDLNL